MSAVRGIIAILLLASQPAFAADSRLPIIDMHLHAMAADANGPPPLGLCSPFPEFPLASATEEWAATFIAWQKKPPCADPVWSPETDEALRQQTLAIMERRNVYGVLSGTPARVRQWRDAAPGRFIAGMGFQLGPDAITPAQMRELYTAGSFEVLAEVTNQYLGIGPSDPRFEPYLAVAEELQFPVGIHVGTGPPGAPYLGTEKYRAALHSALTLEDALVRHPKLRLYIMHAGWPMTDDLLAVLWAHPQVYAEFGAIVFALPRPEFHGFLRRIVQAGFGKRIMFGSDQMVWPGLIERALEAVESAEFLTPEQKRDILYNNAARFLRLSPEEIARHHGG
jgi:predicted TIM-barrel fold metal-dependent hydrolase